MKKYVTEFIGTCLLVLTALMTLNNGNSTMAPIAIGGVLAALYLVGGPISGGHYNPAVTLAALMLGRSSRTDAIYAVLAQMLGGLIAAFFAALLLNCDSASDISTWHQSAACTVLAEFFGAFAWVYALAHLTRFRLESSWQSAALGIGLTGTAMMYALGRLSGGAFNPAMALGFCVLSMIEWADYWMYLLGSLLGAAASATVVIGQLGREE
ncbi:MAG TPA: aquaporin [Saprospiraceae bacterium]|nr:aquaporin [Saprospiraceae bacterium]HND89617.1 aquaporin [Saprospiraceae bacterium]HNG89176.1 aquaporin [Saprospiraceae bacterium]